MDTSNAYVRCNLLATLFRFLRQGNSWFGYINNTQCITGTTNCLLTTAIDPVSHLTSCMHLIISVWPIEQVYSADNASLTLVSCWDPTTVVFALTGIYSCCQCLPLLVSGCVDLSQVECLCWNYQWTTVLGYGEAQ